MTRLGTILRGLGEVLADYFGPHTFFGDLFAHRFDARTFIDECSTNGTKDYPRRDRNDRRDLPHQPDPDVRASSVVQEMIPRVLAGLRRGLAGHRVQLSSPLPRLAEAGIERFNSSETLDEEAHTQGHFTFFLRIVIQPLLRHLCTLPFELDISFRKSNQTMGQKGDGLYELWMEEVEGGERSVKTRLAIEAKTAKNFVSLFTNDRTSDGYVWPALKNTLDIRVYKDAGLVNVLKFGSAMAAKLALQILGTTNGRWGIFWAGPYFVLAEIVEHHGQHYLFLSPLCTSEKQMDASIDASEEPLIAIVLAIMMSDSGVPGFEIPPPTSATKEDVRRRVDEALRFGGSGLPRRAF